MSRHKSASGRKRGVGRPARQAWPSTNATAKRASVPRAERGAKTMMTRDARSPTLLSGEARQAVATALSALSQWRNETFTANDRCLTKVLEEIANAHRALGWPDHVAAAAKEHVLKASKVQTSMIDQAMDVWEQQLQSESTYSGPPGSPFQVPAHSQSVFNIPVPEMIRVSDMTLASFKLWMQTAATCQRNWIAAMSSGVLPKPPRTTKASSETSTMESNPSTP
jgi:cellobiose-specific phosphotransferase system component IIA